MGSMRIFRTNNEAKISTILVISLFLLSFVSIFFVSLPVTAATYREEDFEDDALWGNPSDNWYNYGVMRDPTNWNVSVDNTYAHSGTKSIKHYDEGDGTPSKSYETYYNFTVIEDVNWTTLWGYFLLEESVGERHQQLGVFFRNATGSSTASVNLGDAQQQGNRYLIGYYDGDSWESVEEEGTSTVMRIENETWQFFNFSFNWSEGKWRLYNGSAWSYWYGFHVSGVQNISQIRITGGRQNQQNCWIDDIRVYNASGVPSWTSNFSIGGVDEYDRLTFTGQADEYVWSNETDWGAGSDVIIYTELNVTENCTDIHIDFNSSDIGTITIANNLFIEANVINGSGWDGTTYTVTSNTANISLNDSWSSGWCHGTNPFTIEHSDGNQTIYLRFRLHIPSGTSPDTYLCSLWEILWEVEY